MSINKRSFLIGLILAPILLMGLFGSIGIAQAYGQNRLSDSKNDTPADYTNLANLAFDQPVSPTPQCYSRILQVVAHEDDDLLFMNPDLIHSLNSGACMQTVYLTAGDAGQTPGYWLGREQGAEAAYAKMLGVPMDWQTNQVKISDHYTVNVATLKQAPAVSLIFVRLADGNLFGDGFASTNYESLQKLEAGQINALGTVDGQSSYSLSELVGLITSIINRYQPDQIRTQANDSPDHSDHVAAGLLTAQAYQLFRSQTIAIKSISLSFYYGYTLGSLPQNLTAEDTLQKQNIFWEYAKYDNAACDNIDSCNNASTYGLYLDRRYASQT
jgi:LmbE family N-acetylglucosaminyl deacetylase